MAGEGVDPQAVQEAQLAKEAREPELLGLPNVVGVGIGFKEVKGKATKDLALVVYVEKKLLKKDLPRNAVVPQECEGTKTDVVETGRLEALANTARLRPCRPGFSLGHYRITAGTFGCLVRDRCPPCRTYILSNNHVLANSNGASPGDPVLQPGRYDGGAYPRDLVARLARFVPIRFGSPDRYNLVDAALALPVDLRAVIGPIHGLGLPAGTAEATLGQAVVKTGRTTGTTAGRVTGIDATVAVGYRASGTAYFRNQIITSNMSQGGDSGSLLLERAGRRAVGLLFAGSSRITIHNTIHNVLIALGVELVVA
ncbi:MAG: hypothetical protein D6708_07805 [Candidatus Dadabacteria bacterium]|nr:MAG: hypothetical protein D6708_07805 [Candidatus Dadabacteria bacterium]